MSDTKYNGWANYATWRVNLEVVDSLEPEMFDLERGPELKLADVYEFAKAIEDYVDACLSEQSEGIVLDYARAFLQSVDWVEIAQAMIDTYSEA